MKVVLGPSIVLCMLLVGCTDQANESSSEPQQTSDSGPEQQAPSSEDSSETSASTTSTDADAGDAESPIPDDSNFTAVPIASGVAQLNPENTKIEFVGTHVGDEPNPRTGGFEQFTGKAEVDSGSNALRSVAIEIKTNSVWTQIERLTNHLESPDFFDSREFPKLTFQSTSIVPRGDAGQYTITGDLTLLEATKEISFPAAVRLNEAGITLSGAFKINRMEFGMDRLQERVENEVALVVAIGEKTQPLPPQARGGGGGRRRSGGGGGRGGFDPAAIFRRLDANEDGKLTGDEISDRLQENIKDIDTNGDGEITLEEFQAGRGQTGGRRGGGGGGGGGGEDRSRGRDGDRGGQDQPKKTG